MHGLKVLMGGDETSIPLEETELETRQAAALFGAVLHRRVAFVKKMLASGKQSSCISLKQATENLERI